MSTIIEKVSFHEGFLCLFVGMRPPRLPSPVDSIREATLTVSPNLVVNLRLKLFQRCKNFCSWHSQTISRHFQSHNSRHARSYKTGLLFSCWKTSIFGLYSLYPNWGQCELERLCRVRSARRTTQFSSKFQTPFWQSLWRDGSRFAPEVPKTPATRVQTTLLGHSERLGSFTLECFVRYDRHREWSSHRNVKGKKYRWLLIQRDSLRTTCEALRSTSSEMAWKNWLEERNRKNLTKWNSKTHQNPSVLCTPPFEKSPIKVHRFCMYSPLWKITHQSPSVLCTPPFEKSPIKAIGFVYSPLWKITVFGGCLFRGRAFISANTVSYD